MSRLFRFSGIIRTFVVVFIAASVYLNFAPSQSVYAQALDETGGTTEDEAADAAKDGTTCAIEKIGWILCPIMEGAAKIADKTFSVLANNFLQVEPQLLADDGAKPAWELARNLANIMFVIAFLAIVYSQITGSGLNNYGIKRMLPRLIIAAIAVNVSFYICQILVDISNIMGFAIKETLAAASNSVGPSVLGGSPQDIDTETGGGVLTYITVGALAAAGVVWLILGPTALIITTVLITALTVIVILLLRKAILVLLVVASPIAFVMYLLPNTEKLFDKWLKMFWGLLMVFPVVAALFGGGQLASTIILMAGASTPSQNTNVEQCVAEAEKKNAEKTQAQKDADAVSGGYTVPCEGMLSISSPDSSETAQAGWMLGLVATGIAVAPLLAVWAVLKGALAAAGAIGGRIAANVQKGSGRAIGAPAATRKAFNESSVGKWRSRVADEKKLTDQGGDYKGSNPYRRTRQAVYKNIQGRDKTNSNGNTTFAGHIRKGIEKDEAEYIRGKAQDAIAKGDYGITEDMLSRLHSSDDKERKMAEQDIKIQKMAIGSQEGRAGLEIAEEKIASYAPVGGGDAHPMVTRAAETLQHTKGKMQEQQQMQAEALSTALAPHLQQRGSVSSVGGGVSSGPSSNTGGSGMQRLSFNATGGGGGLGTAHNGREILNQFGTAGGAGNVATEDLVRAVKHANDHLSSGGSDIGHTEMATQAVEALAARGLDHEGRASGRGPGSTNPSGL